MKKTWKKWVSALLTLVLLAAVVCVPTALAAEKAPNEYGIKKMVVLGDSVAQGKNDDTPGSGGYFGCFDVGYTTRVASALGLVDTSKWHHTYDNDRGHFYSLVDQSAYRTYCAVGLRSDEVLNQLNGKYSIPEETFTAKEHWIYDRIQDFPGLREDLLKDIKDSQLILISVGENDIFVGPLNSALWETMEEYEVEDMEASDLLILLGISEGNMTLPEGFDKTNFLLEFSKKFLTYVVQGYGRFLKNYPLILQEIRKQNPNAQIVVNGFMNPLHYTTLLDNKLPITIGEVLDSVVLPADSVIATVGAAYGATYLPVADIPLSSDQHPTTAGYQTIANRIIEKLHPATNYKDLKFLSTENQKAVLWGATTGAFTGITDTKFVPTAYITVGQVTNALNTLAGGDAGLVVTSPNRVCPRKQLISLLFQYAQKQNDATALSYSDALKWASDLGITEGVGTLAMNSIAPCTRAQAVLFLYRFAQAMQTSTLESAQDEVVELNEVVAELA